MYTKIAQVAHEANRAYCQIIGDDSQDVWDDAPQWQRDAVVACVKAKIENPGITPEQSHVDWLKTKEGWKYGPIKSIQLKEHPCLVPYTELTPEQKMKGFLFSAIVRVLS